MISPVPASVAAMDDAGLAWFLASGAGQVLVALRAEVDAGRLAGDPAALRGAGDATTQAWLAAALAAARPDDAVLSEEATDDPRRLAADRVWIIDPLDGTREFAERRADGSWRDDFAVHVALWQRGRGLTDAAVALPALSLVYDTRAPAGRGTATGASLAGGERIRVAVSRSRPPDIAAALARNGAVELVPMGSCGFKAMRVVDGTVDAYLHAGGQHEWDSAAPVAVARAAGLVATRLDGSELVYNQPRPWSPDLLVCRPGLVARLRVLLRAVDAHAGVGR